MALLHCPYSRIVLRSNYYYCSSQTDCISYRCTLYQFGASLAAIPSSGDLHGRFYSVSHASHEPPLKASTFLAANHFGSSAGDKAWHHRARISEDVEVVMAHGPWPVQFSERGVGRMTENATFWLLTPASVLWRTRGVLFCRAQTIMFLNASATLPGDFSGRPQSAPQLPFVETWFRLERLPWARTSWYQRAPRSTSHVHARKSWVSMKLTSALRCLLRSLGPRRALLEERLAGPWGRHGLPHIAPAISLSKL
jgi:hypothetical protein